MDKAILVISCHKYEYCKFKKFNANGSFIIKYTEDVSFIQAVKRADKCFELTINSELFEYFDS